MRKKHAIPAIIFGSLCIPVKSFSANTLVPYVEYKQTYESNVLRIHDQSSAVAQLGTDQTSDIVKRTSAGLRFDMEYSNQHLNATAQISKTHFDKFHTLDNTSRLISGRWDWRVGKDIDGLISADYESGLAPYEDFRSINRVARTRRNAFASIKYLFAPSWRMRGQLGNTKLAYDAGTLETAASKVDSAIVGVDFLPSSGSSIGLQAGLTRGHDVTPLRILAFNQNTDYRQADLKIAAMWKALSHLEIDFLGGLVSRREQNKAARDFNGFNARLQSEWTPTAKLRFSTAAYREFGAVSDPVANYTLNQGADLAAIWDATYRIKVQIGVQAESRNYAGTTQNIERSSVRRNDHLKRASIVVAYIPTSHLKVTAGISRENVDSSIVILGYRANKGEIAARYEF